MDFNTWYVIFVLGFASGFAVCRLWDEALTLLRSVFRRNGNRKPNGGHI